MQGRIRNSLRNVVFGIGGQIITILFSFISRTVFLYCFTQEYVGVSSLFSGIFSVLSLADLGMETSMTVHLYKPLAERDHEQILAHLCYYKRAFYIISGIIGALGVFLLPFLEVIVDIPEGIQNIKLIYLLTLSNTVVSYLFIYRKILLIADQKKYITDIIDFSKVVLQFIIIIPLLLITHSYVLYLVSHIVFTILYNIAVMWKAQKVYPYLSEKNTLKLDETTRASIRTDMSSISLHRIGDVVNANVDTILTAACVSVIAVGKYSNYHMIINYVKLILDKVYYAISPSVGNLIAEGNKNKILNTFNRMMYISMVMVAFCGACLIGLLNPFIAMWAGKDYLLQMDVVVLLVLNFLIANMRKPALIFKEAYGFFKNDRFRPVAESLLNLLLSYTFAKIYHMGLKGILLGTVIASLLSSFWIEPYVLFKNGFKSEPSYYFKMYGKYAIIILLVICSSYSLTLFCSGNMIGFIIKLIICMIVPCIIISAVTLRTEEFKWCISLAKKAIKKVCVRR